jgi:hypothetical protein
VLTLAFKRKALLSLIKRHSITSEEGFMRHESSILLLWVLTIPCAWAQKSGDTKGASTGAAKPSDAVHDVVANTFSATGVKATDLDHLDEDLDRLKSGTPIIWDPHDVGRDYKAVPRLFSLASTYVSGDGQVSPCATNVAADQAYLFHVTHWAKRGDATGDSPATLVSSDWYVYRHPRLMLWQKTKMARYLTRADLTGAGDPLIYGASKVLIISIDRFDPTKDASGQPIPSAGRLGITYSLTVTQGTPENTKDLGALASALGGLSQSFMAAGGAETYGAYIGVACQEGTKKLPFDLAVTDAVVQASPASTQGMNSSQRALDSAPAASPGNATCSGLGNTTPCSMNRTFTSADREFWDVSIGVAIPGVRETSYTFSTTTSKLSSSVTTHTDLYALLDLYPFGALKPKESWVPHIDAGIPVTSKSFYRPYFGISENLTGWTHLQKALSLPAAVNFFVGMTFMKTQVIVGPPPTTQDEFNFAIMKRRVWKPMFGIEVPVGSIASKLGGKGGGSGGKNANGSGKGGS